MLVTIVDSLFHFTGGDQVEDCVYECFTNRLGTGWTETYHRDQRFTQLNDSYIHSYYGTLFMKLRNIIYETEDLYHPRQGFLNLQISIGPGLLNFLIT